jgi:acetyltransferase EpsM
MTLRVVIFGAGGHAQVVADILLSAHEQGAAAVPIGYIDDDPGLTGQMRLGLPVFGTTTVFPEVAHEAVIVAIGHNSTRRRVFERLLAQGEQLVTACHPRATVAPDVRLGAGCMVCAGVVVNPGSTIGANVILNTGCTVDHHNQIGDHVHIAPGAHLGGEVTIEAGVLVGIGATVMPRRRVGAWSVVGAAALVHQDLPGGVIAVGVPARISPALKR